MSGVLLKSPAMITAACPAASAKPFNAAFIAAIPVRQSPTASELDVTGEMTWTLATSGPNRTPGTCSRAAAIAVYGCFADTAASGNQLHNPIPPASGAGMSTEYGNTSPRPACDKRQTSSGVNSDTVVTSALSLASP